MINDRMFRGGHYAAELETPEVYRERRRRLQDRLDAKGVAVVLGATDARGYGDVGTFRQDPSFYYLTGVELPGAVLVLEKQHETLFLPARRPNVEAWTGPKFGPGDESANVLGFETVLDRDASEFIVDARRRPQPGFVDRLVDMISGGTVWVILPGQGSGELTAEQKLVQSLRDRIPSFTVRDLAPDLAEMRLSKGVGEVALMRKAIAATIAGVRAAAGSVKAGAREGAVEGSAFAAIRSTGAEGWSFPPIVGSGQAGCILHYDSNIGLLGASELVVVDIGARYGYYCGDLTRTLPVDGRFTDRQRGLYEAVLAAYDAAVGTLRPGATLATARKAAFAALEANPLRGDDGKTLGQFFIHGIGHFLGLEAHDAGGEGPAFKPGMIITIEPGIYLPGEGIGIRVEDDYLITETGAENLSAALPRDIASIETMITGASSA